MLTNLNRVLIINFCILLVINIIAFSSESSHDRISIMALLIFLQFCVNLIISILHLFSIYKAKAKDYVLAAIIVVVIGFSTCMVQIEMSARGY